MDWQLTSEQGRGRNLLIWLELFGPQNLRVPWSAFEEKLTRFYGFEVDRTVTRAFENIRGHLVSGGSGSGRETVGYVDYDFFFGAGSIVETIVTYMDERSHMGRSSPSISDLNHCIHLHGIDMATYNNDRKIRGAILSLGQLVDLESYEDGLVLQYERPTTLKNILYYITPMNPVWASRTLRGVQWIRLASDIRKSVHNNLDSHMVVLKSMQETIRRNIPLRHPVAPVTCLYTLHSIAVMCDSNSVYQESFILAGGGLLLSEILKISKNSHFYIQEMVLIIFRNLANNPNIVTYLLDFDILNVASLVLSSTNHVLKSYAASLISVVTKTRSATTDIGEPTPEEREAIEGEMERREKTVKNVGTLQYVTRVMCSDATSKPSPLPVLRSGESTHSGSHRASQTSQTSQPPSLSRSLTSATFDSLTTTSGDPVEFSPMGVEASFSQLVVEEKLRMGGKKMTRPVNASELYERALQEKIPPTKWRDFVQLSLTS